MAGSARPPFRFGIILVSANLADLQRVAAWLIDAAPECSVFQLAAAFSPGSRARSLTGFYPHAHGDCYGHSHSHCNSDTYTYSTSASHTATTPDPAPLVEVTSSPAVATTEAGE